MPGCPPKCLANTADITPLGARACIKISILSGSESGRNVSDKTSIAGSMSILKAVPATTIFHAIFFKSSISAISVPKSIKFIGIATPPISFKNIFAESPTYLSSPVHIKKSPRKTDHTGPFFKKSKDIFLAFEIIRNPTDQNIKSQPTLKVSTSPVNSEFGIKIATSAIMKKP